MEPNDDLHDVLTYSLTRAALAASSDTIAFYALARINRDYAYVYAIKPNAIEICKEIVIVDQVDALLEAWKYILEQEKSREYGHIFWGHGYGVLMPVYDVQSNQWTIVPDGDNAASCSFRGILSNSQARTCLSNQEMINFFHRLVNTYLDGTKLAFCGLDCCKGAMVEHAYQLAPYVSYLVASQECELADGWDYYDVLALLGQQPSLSPEQLVRGIVDGYARYYQSHSQRETYTLSAINTSIVREKIAPSIQSFVDCYTKLPLLYKKIGYSYIHEARTACIGFCDAPMYIDLSMLGNHLLQAFGKSDDIYFDDIKNSLEEWVKAAGDAVVCKTGGRHVEHAQGMSIYFPKYRIDSSYMSAPFANDIGWRMFLERYVGYDAASV